MLTRVVVIFFLNLKSKSKSKIDQNKLNFVSEETKNISKITQLA